MAESWIGTHYEATRLLLLGESAYSWLQDGEVQHPRDDHAEISVRAAIKDFPLISRFMVMVSRGLANDRDPSEERLKYVWDRVAFTNYIAKSVGGGARISPTPKMWEDAKRDFPALLASFNPSPRRIIVLGTTMWDNMPPADIVFSDEVQGYRIANGEVAVCWALNHPSHGLSWRQLSAAIHFTYERELQHA